MSQISFPLNSTNNKSCRSFLFSFIKNCHISHPPSSISHPPSSILFLFLPPPPCCHLSSGYPFCPLSSLHSIEGLVRLCIQSHDLNLLLHSVTLPQPPDMLFVLKLFITLVLNTFSFTSGRKSHRFISLWHKAIRRAGNTPFDRGKVLHLAYL